MTMRRFWACLMMCFMAATCTLAQEPLPSARDLLTVMKDKLELTDDQVDAVTPIVQKYAAKLQDLRQAMNDQANEDRLQALIKKLRHDEGQELSQVLSSDQLGRWKQLLRSFPRQTGGEVHPQQSQGNGGNIGPARAAPVS